MHGARERLSAMTMIRASLRAAAWSLLAGMAVLSGCQTQGPAVPVPIYTAGSENLTGVKKLAVAPFKNDANDEFARIVETNLTNSKIRDRGGIESQAVELVGTTTTKTVAKPGLSDAEAAALAKRLNVDAVLLGEVVERRQESQRYERSKQVCTREETVDQKKKRTKCVQWREVAVPCVKNTTALRVSYRVVSKAGEVLALDRVDGDASENVCEGRKVEEGLVFFGSGDATPTTQRQMLENVMLAVAQKVQRDVVPSSVSTSVNLMASSAGIANDKMKEQFDSAMKFAKANRFDRACEIFREVYAQEKQSPGLTYNVGVCDEVDGQIEAARLKYVQADKLTTEPDPVIGASLKRLEKQYEVRTRIAAKRGMDIAPDVRRTGSGAPKNPINVAATSGPPEKLKELMKKESRVALVIGNASYRQIDSLKNSINDAAAVETQLKQLGFNVVSGRDLTYQQMTQTLNAFKQRLKAGDVGLVFYAGHGLSSKSGENFWLPVDFELKYAQKEDLLKSRAFSIEQQVLKGMKDANTRVQIVVADACRSIPKLQASTRGLSAGMAPPKRLAKGSLVSYSAGIGQEAEDGVGENGTYTTKLLEALRIPNLSAGEMFKLVQRSVATETNEAQVPAVYDELLGEFYFRVE